MVRAAVDCQWYPAAVVQCDRRGRDRTLFRQSRHSGRRQQRPDHQHNGQSVRRNSRRRQCRDSPFYRRKQIRPHPRIRRYGGNYIHSVGTPSLSHRNNTDTSHTRGHECSGRCNRSGRKIPADIFCAVCLS